ncbi:MULTISPECIES: alpha/beta hydrolase [unclassified Chelatococcus]|uniref:alpha/beta fold hydrolase n=1 Tax=unclassified Chelatococcus TaxID=2638111 RepID=UPI001BCA9701|nr:MULTISPECIES: alpha/beta hydrolase [unclassified Chelatococcus]MBS7700259.1 alpha/beta hydrolase [Chelatococcus sp. YT9]MBX3558230.1 alpha/beta hydrolase [Chelatococcus sp.]
MVETIISETVGVAGIDIQLCTTGQGEPLLFLHSGPGPTYDSREFLVKLGQDNAVLAPYHPGFGPLPRPDDFETIDDLAYCYMGLLNARRLRGIPVIGASIGGWIAAEIAIRDPAAFAALILINPLGLRVGAPMDRPIADIWAMSRAERRRIQFHQPLFQTDHLDQRSDQELLELARFEETLVRYAWRPFLHNPRLGRWLRRIQAPTLVIRGDEDNFVSGTIHDAFVEQLPQAHIARVGNAGHHPHVEQPDEVISLIRNFLRAR